MPSLMRASHTRLAASSLVRNSWKDLRSNFLRVKVIFAVRIEHVAYEFGRLAIPPMHSLVDSSQTRLQLFQYDSDLLATRPFPVTVISWDGRYLGVGFVQRYEFDLIGTWGMNEKVVTPWFAELAYDVVPHQMPLFLRDLDCDGWLVVLLFIKRYVKRNILFSV